MSDLGVMPCLSPQPSRSPIFSCIKCLTKKTQTVAERLRVLNGFAVPVNKCRDAGFVCVFAFTYNCKTARRPKLAICTMRLYAETDLISSFFSLSFSFSLPKQESLHTRCFRQNDRFIERFQIGVARKFLPHRLQASTPRSTTLCCENSLLHCALSLAAQCSLLLSVLSVCVCVCVCLFVCGSVTTIIRNCVNRSSLNLVCR